MKIAKSLACVAILCLLVSLHAQSDDVTLTVMGQGKTIEEAQQQAFRDAIMQTYGVFVSSNSEVANEKLKADSVNIITNGSVKRFEVVSKQDNPDGTKAVMLKVVVSTQNLGAFFEGASGSTAKISGGLIAFKFKQQKLNELNEVDSIKNMVEVLKSILDRSFDYSATIAAEPYVSNTNPKEYVIPVQIDIKFNKNVQLFVEYFEKTIGAIQLTKNEADSYLTSNKKVYLMRCLTSAGSPVIRNLKSGDGQEIIPYNNQGVKSTMGDPYPIYLRARKSISMITDLIFKYLPDRNFGIKENSGEFIFKLGTNNYGGHKNESSESAETKFRRELEKINTAFKFEDFSVLIFNVIGKDPAPGVGQYSYEIYENFTKHAFMKSENLKFYTEAIDYIPDKIIYSQEKEEYESLFLFLRTFKPGYSAFRTTVGISVNQNVLERLTELKAVGKGSDLSNGINIDIPPDKEATAAKPAASRADQQKEIRFPESGFPAWKFSLPDGWEVVPADKGSFRIMNAAKTGSIDVNATDLVTQSKLESAIVDFLKGAEFDVRKRNSSKIAGRDGFKYNKVIKSPEGADLNLELSMVVIENRYLLNRIVFTGVRHPDEMEFHRVAETMKIVDK